MNAFRRSLGAGAALLVTLLLVVGCRTHSTQSADSAASAGSANSAASGPASVATSTAEVNTTPATEGSGPESPQPSVNGGPSVSLASLPVGGGSVGNDSGAQQCVEVNWVGAKPIPPGVTIHITGFATNPSGIFDIGGNACPSGKRLCSSSWQWEQANEDSSCLVAGTQVADGEGDVLLTVSAIAHCADQQACSALANAVAHGPGSSIAFQARHENVSGASSGGTSASGTSSSGVSSGGSVLPSPSGGGS